MGCCATKKESRKEDKANDGQQNDEDEEGMADKNVSRRIG